MTSKTEIKNVIDVYGKLVSEKQPFMTHWQIVSEFVFQRKQFFNGEFQQGDFLHSDIFNSDAPKALERSSSALLGYIWTKGGKTPYLEIADTDLKNDSQTIEFFENATSILQDSLDDPEASLQSTLDEAMKDDLSFGTSCVTVNEGKKVDLSFQNYTVSDFVVDEDENGFVDTIMILVKMTARQIVMKFGFDKCSEKIQKAYQNTGNQDKFDLLFVIKPRLDRDKTKKGNLNMPYQQLWIEKNEKVLLNESGFWENPAAVSRFSKISREKYGRSPAMSALPEIMQLNEAWEMLFIAAEKQLEPPLLIQDDGKIGIGKIETGAMGINVVNVTGAASSRAPIEPLFTVGSLKEMEWVTEKLANSINDHFYIDRLINLNNETQMTAREALIRNAIRNSLLSSITARMISERFNPIVERSFNILFRNNKFGYTKNTKSYEKAIAEGRKVKLVPDAVANYEGNGKRLYRIKYNNTASLDAKAASATAIMDTWGFAIDLAARAGKKEGLIMLDAKKSVKLVASALGADNEIFLKDDEVKKIEEQEKLKEGAAMALQGAQQLSQVNVNNAKVDSMNNAR